MFFGQVCECDNFQCDRDPGTGLTCGGSYNLQCLYNIINVVNWFLIIWCPEIVNTIYFLTLFPLIFICDLASRVKTKTMIKTINKNIVQFCLYTEAM